MKKVTVKRVIEEGEGICDFCGEPKKGFISQPIEKSYSAIDGDCLDLDWFKKCKRYEYDFWGNSKTYKERLCWATTDIKYKTGKVYFKSLICEDCIKQLN